MTARERRPLTFRQSDVARAIRAVKAMGLPITGVRIDPQGGIDIDTHEGPATPATSFDDWKARRDARKA